MLAHDSARCSSRRRVTGAPALDCHTKALHSVQAHGIVNPVLIVAAMLVTMVCNVYVGSQVGAASDQLVYSLLHSCLVYLLAAGYLYVVSARSGTWMFHPASLLILVHILYFSATTVMYFSDNPVYVCFDLELTTRFLGSLMAALGLGSVLLLLNYQIGLLPREFQWRFASPPAPFAVLLFLTASVLIKWRLFSLGFSAAYFESSLNINNASSGELIVIMVANILGFVLVGVATQSYMSRKSVVYAVLLACSFGLEFSWHVLFTKSRFCILSSLIVPGMILASTASIPRRELIKNCLFLTLVIAPGVFSLGQSTLLILLGRGEEGSLQESCDQSAYRLCLSDYAMVLLERPASSTTAARFFIEAIEMNLPKLLFPNKATSSVAIDSAHVAVGIPPEIDYPDTLFSAGAMIFGWIGFFAVPWLYFSALCLATRLLARRSLSHGLSMYLLLALAIACVYIELGPAEIVATVRYIVGLYMPLAAAFWVLDSLIRQRRALTVPHVG